MGQRLGPFLPLPTAPSILLPGGPTSREMGEEGGPAPAAESQVAEARKAGLGLPAPEAYGKRTGQGWWGRGLDRLRSEMVPCLLGPPEAGGLRWGPATLVRQEAAASQETPSQPPSPGGEEGL